MEILVLVDFFVRILHGYKVLAAVCSNGLFLLAS